MRGREGEGEENRRGERLKERWRETMIDR